MPYHALFPSPIGDIALVADEMGLTGLGFAVGHDFLDDGVGGSTAISAAKRWLSQYFAGQVPDFTPPLHLIGTPFQLEVWEMLTAIPYGETVTYGEIAAMLAKRHGKPMSAQAVGGAVGRNPIAIILPCHRVLGARGKLTGYAGGIDKKIALLHIEKIPFIE